MLDFSLPLPYAPSLIMIPAIAHSLFPLRIDRKAIKNQGRFCRKVPGIRTKTKNLDIRIEVFFKTIGYPSYIDEQRE
jgi:hypothetical protein